MQVSGGRMRVRDWKTVLKNSLSDINDNHTQAFAAGLSFYFLLSLFPALIAISAVLSLLPVQDLFSRILQMSPRFIPADSMGVVRGIVQDIMKSNHQELFSLGLLGTLWSASTGFASMIEALNVAYEVPESRSFVKTRSLALLMTFIVGALVLIAFALMVVGPDARRWLMAAHLPLLAKLWPVVRWAVSVSFVVLAVEITYLWGPNVRQHVRHTLVGAVIAVAAWLALSYGLAVYFQRFAHLNATYGALGGAIALMIWLYWSFFIVLLGAELNGESMKASGAKLQTKDPVLERATPRPARTDRAA